MPATIDPDLHRFNYVTGTNETTRLAGMDEGGAAWIHPHHWLAEVGKNWLPAASGGQIKLNYHLIEYLFLDAFMFKEPAMAIGQGWSLKFPLVSQLMAELCWVKIPQNCLDKQETRELITKWAKENLTLTQRTVVPAGLLQDPITSADWHAAATNKMVAGPTGAEGQDQDLSKLRQFRMLLAGDTIRRTNLRLTSRASSTS